MYIHGPKTPYETSRNQLESCSTPSNLKAKIVPEMCKKSYFISTVPPQAGTVHTHDDNLNLQQHSCFLGVKGATEGTSFCLARLGE